MHITIHCGGMPFDGYTIESFSLGGSETAAYYVARELAAVGHNVTLFTSITDPSEKDGVRYIPMGPVTQATPLGRDFHHYAENTPTDVMIIQRHPQAFHFRWASKANYLWLHDLASYRTKDMILAGMIHVDGILAVSQWHKEQIVEVLGVPENVVLPIQNGVDLSLYEDAADVNHGLPDVPGKKLIYSSRPERGLENLVKEGGIMDQLAQTDTEHHLFVCSYDNVAPQMAGYYDFLYRRCAELDNVTVLGNLTKSQLASVQKQCDLAVYPTAFEETSCITAMECMAAKLPMITSVAGALPETTRGAGVWLVPLTKNDDNYRGQELRIAGKVDCEEFTKTIVAATPPYIEAMRRSQDVAREKYAWSHAVHQLLGHIRKSFSAAQEPAAVRKELMRNSDIYALREYDTLLPKTITENKISAAVRTELQECYSFIGGGWADHYAAYYAYERDRGVNYGPESLDGNHRFEFVSSLISQLPSGATVLDYGCAHGHYTINLAKRFPALKFIGVDITQSNINTAIQWAEDDGVQNAVFYRAAVDTTSTVIDVPGAQPGSVDCVIAAEVLEHLEDPAMTVDVLAELLAPGGKMIITVPYGPWEAQGYREHWPWRAHVHHFDKADLQDLYGMHPDFRTTVVPAGADPAGRRLGSYVITFGKPAQSSGEIDYGRKFSLTKPQQTLSLCMIARDAADSIERCLSNVLDIVDEVIIGVDIKTTDATLERATAFLDAAYIPHTVFPIESPTESGFDAARNKTLERASGQWILWLDADEILDNAVAIPQYLRANMFDGYAIPQHHFSMQPAGIMKTDYPVRLFRNGLGIRFFGVVHEHPERGLNEGVGHVTTLPGAEIAHHGYQNEGVRRQRFQRNISLLARDRELYPDRYLGKFLWLRDLSQMNGFELEQNGGRVTDAIIRRAERGVEIFQELVDEKKTFRMALDGVDFYSSLSRILGGTDVDATVQGRRIKGYFHKVDHFNQMVNRIIQHEVKQHENSKYY